MIALLLTLFLGLLFGAVGGVLVAGLLHHVDEDDRYLSQAPPKGIDPLAMQVMTRQESHVTALLAEVSTRGDRIAELESVNRALVDTVQELQTAIKTVRAA